MQHIYSYLDLGFRTGAALQSNDERRAFVSDAYATAQYQKKISGCYVCATSAGTAYGFGTLTCASFEYVLSLESDTVVAT
jgi:hypothetical protein